MNSAQAQSENDRPYWAETEMTESERREWEDYMDSLYNEARLMKVEEEF